MTPFFLSKWCLAEIIRFNCYLKRLSQNDQLDYENQWNKCSQMFIYNAIYWKKCRYIKQKWYRSVLLQITWHQIKQKVIPLLWYKSQFKFDQLALCNGKMSSFILSKHLPISTLQCTYLVVSAIVKLGYFWHCSCSCSVSAVHDATYCLW